MFANGANRQFTFARLAAATAAQKAREAAKPAAVSGSHRKAA